MVGSSSVVGAGVVPGCVASIGAVDGFAVFSVGAVVVFATGAEAGEADGGISPWADGAMVGFCTEVGGDVFPGCTASVGP